MKKIYKKEEGVSPVIATILMVAITVVLAATVWLMVSGYMGGTGGTQITGSFATKEMYNSTAWKLTFSQFQPDTKITQLKITITNGSNTYTVEKWKWNSEKSKAWAQLSGINIDGSDNTNLTYYDLAENDVINSGDYLILSNLKPGNTYTVTLLDSNGNQICSTSFTA